MQAFFHGHWGISMKTTNDWRQYLSGLVDARLEVMHAVQPVRTPHYLERGVSHRRRTGSKIKEGACPLWSPGIAGRR